MKYDISLTARGMTSVCVPRQAMEESLPCQAVANAVGSLSFGDFRIVGTSRVSAEWKDGDMWITVTATGYTTVTDIEAESVSDAKITAMQMIRNYSLLSTGDFDPKDVIITDAEVPA